MRSGKGEWLVRSRKVGGVSKVKERGGLVRSRNRGWISEVNERGGVREVKERGGVKKVKGRGGIWGSRKGGSKTSASGVVVKLHYLSHFVKVTSIGITINWRISR